MASMGTGWMDLLDEPPLQEVTYRNVRAVPPLVVRRTSRVELFVPVPPAARIWSHVRLRVSFGDSDRNFHLSGRVLPGGSGEVGGEGFFLAIEERAELRAFRHLWGHVTGERREQAERRSASIPCSVRTGSGALRGRILDVSESGAFVAVSGGAVPHAGAAIELRVRGGFLWLRSREIRAHLVWRGRKAGRQGFGAEFDEDGRPAVVELLGARVGPAGGAGE